MSVGGEQRPGELFKFKMARCEFVILLRPETPADNIARGGPGPLNQPNISNLGNSMFKL